LIGSNVLSCSSVTISSIPSNNIQIGSPNGGGSGNIRSLSATTSQFDCFDNNRQLATYTNAANLLSK
jgi:hypothetical protein